MKRQPDSRALIGLASAVLLLFAAGCGQGLSTGYGASKGSLAKRSINGFSTLRNSFVAAGFEHRDLTRLTDRARNSSVIVWTPSHPSGIELTTTGWFDRWLRMGDKTLIYVIPDSGSASDFYRDAREIAPPEQRLEYRRKYAESLLQEHQWQMARTGIPSNGWFYAKPKVQQTEIILAEQAEGENWQEFGSQDLRNRNASSRFEWVIEPYDRDNNAQQVTPIWQPAGPGSPTWTIGQAVSPTTTKVDFAPVLESEDGDTLLARVTSESWDNSQILVVAGGSLLTNYGLTRSENRLLAESLIDGALAPMIDASLVDAETHLRADGSNPLASFAMANSGLPVSEPATDIPRATGLETLTTFPLSAVTIHISIIGLVICLMLLPIFGRPRHIDRGVLTHFGDHLSAVATLMKRRGGETFARQRISEYMKLVRGETAGPWVIETPTHPTSHPISLHVPDPNANPAAATAPRIAAAPATAPEQASTPEQADSSVLHNPPDETNSRDRG